MAARIRTLEDIAWRGLRLRVWCFGCARSRELDAGEMLQLFVRRGWSIWMVDAFDRFRCDRCRSKRGVLIVPASPLPPAPPAPIEEPEPERPWAQQVAAFFHANRAMEKRKRRDAKSNAAVRPLASAKPAPEIKRTPPRRGHLRVVKG